MGHAISSKWNGIGMTHPTNYKIALEAIHEARVVAKEVATATTILIVNHNNRSTQQLLLNQHVDIHMLATTPTLHLLQPITKMAPNQMSCRGRNMDGGAEGSEKPGAIQFFRKMVVR